jgi:LemA protein
MRSLTLSVVLILLGLIVFATGCNTYNSLVSNEEDVENAWSKVQTAYQRRSDLIPNLVNTVKGAANFEQKTLQGVIEARSKATAITIDPTNATPEQLMAYQNAQSGLSQALGRLMSITENYPTLQANKGFIDLQAQLEGTENRINVTRDRYNEAVNIYEVASKRFPTVIFAKLFGFKEMARFKAEEGAEKAPEVDFNFDEKK